MFINYEEKNNQMLNVLKNKKISKMEPIIIELDETPNSGKTTVAEQIYRIFKKNFANCSYIVERAINCEINDKLSPKFNFVTGSETAVKIIEEIENGKK